MKGEKVMGGLSIEPHNGIRAIVDRICERISR